MHPFDLRSFYCCGKRGKDKTDSTFCKQLQEVGIQPDILVLRTEHELSNEIRRKVALFCNVAPEAVIQSIDVPSIYEVPLKMQQQKLDEIVLTKTGMPVGSTPELNPWKEFLAA